MDLKNEPQKTDQLSGSSRFGLTFWTQIIVITFLLIAGLAYAASILIPLALALLLFVLITAIVDRVSLLKIGSIRMPSWLAHIISLGIVSLGLLGVLSILSNQAGDVAEAFPRYEQRFSQILSRVVALVGDKNYAAAESALSDLDISALASGAISSAGAFLSALFLVLLYLPFMMVERAPMNKKLELVARDAEFREKLRKILSSMSVSLQRYVGIKSLVSLITGLGSYAFMKPVGLDFAETWAVLAFMLNFIPTIGSILGVAVPALVALVQFDTVTPFLIILCGCGGVQFVVGNILEPALTGRSLNLSPLMVILALTFWTAIWGMAGALLSVPITVCFLIVMSHIPATRTIAILMSGDGNLLDDVPNDTDREASR
ncbi:AI-2E family transporter [uncultured Shimia sp.]|uniref:AI-2E family transporter n=1 Tax=uncultured Shimia sp. TaxID=573152 RepID=UPI00260A91B0|nr:AI-2E family transporter [uncultured Shimia sp.]